MLIKSEFPQNLKNANMNPVFKNDSRNNKLISGRKHFV